MNDEPPRQLSACMIGVIAVALYYVWVLLSYVLLMAGWFWLAAPFLILDLGLFEWVSDPHMGTGVMLIGLPAVIFVVSVSIARWRVRPVVKR